MTRSQMQSAVLQYTALATFTMILYHELNRNAYDSVWADPVLKNLTDTMNATYNTAAANDPKFKNVTALTSLNNTQTTVNGTSYNITISGVKNANTTAPPPLWEEAEAFYSKQLPRSMAAFVILGVLSYYWHVGLERFFPTRPRGVEIDYSKVAGRKEKEKDVGDNEGQEEEVIKRWIAQGKVRRSSVSWWNTFVKFIIHMSLGKLWFHTVNHVLHGLIKALFRWHSPSKELSSLKSGIILSILTSYLSITPLTSLISFIVIPAPRRIVFSGIVNAAETAFFGLFYRTVIPWAVQTEFVQDFIRNVTEATVVGREGGMKMGQAMVDEGRLIDEL